MLNPLQIQALMDGEYGVTRGGLQVKYLGKTVSNKYGWALYKNGYLNGADFSYDDFCNYFLDEESSLDIVGLWEDKPEPFNLERALTGQGVQYKEGDTDYPSYIVGKSYITDEYYLEISEGECVSITLNDLQKNYVMWKEPENAQDQYKELPKPITEFGDLNQVWFIHKKDLVYEPCESNKFIRWNDFQIQSLENRCYYATKEDCQKVCNWLMSR